MRYRLRAGETEVEIGFSVFDQKDVATRYTVSTSHDDVPPEQTEVVLTPGLVQVCQPDGSLRNLAYTAESNRDGVIGFFYRGKRRTVLRVGGVASRVEDPQSAGTVTAPMNGQVIKVSAQIGDQVKCGDIVLILEAMKMENEVTAPISGTLTELSVAVGQTVSPGQALFQIEATE